MLVAVNNLRNKVWISRLDRSYNSLRLAAPVSSSSCVDKQHMTALYHQRQRQRQPCHTQHQFESSQRMSFHFASSDYAKAFQNLPVPDVDGLKLSALQYLDTFNEQSWYDDPVSRFVFVSHASVKDYTLPLFWVSFNLPLLPMQVRQSFCSWRRSLTNHAYAFRPTTFHLSPPFTSIDRIIVEWRGIAWRICCRHHQCTRSGQWPAGVCDSGTSTGNEGPYHVVPVTVKRLTGSITTDRTEILNGL